MQQEMLKRSNAHFIAPKLYKVLRCITFVLCSVILFLASACSKSAHEQTLRLSSAKHFDIPSPLGFVSDAKRTVTKPDYDYLTYTGSQPHNKVLAFYQRELEKNGWDITDLSHPNEGLILGKKPHKICSISIRNTSGKTAVHVFVKQQLLGS